jgi:hypothetical protein
LCWYHHRLRHADDTNSRGAQPEDRHSWATRFGFEGAPSP